MILITTYNREDHLCNLLFDIEIQGFTDEVLIIDDGTKHPIDFRQYRFPIQYLRFEENHGKKRYFEVISYAFKSLKNKQFDYLWQLPDDVRLKEDFFERSLKAWEHIQSKNKICLSTGYTNDRILHPCWTEFTPKKLSPEIMWTQFNDLCYLAPRKFFEVLEWDIEKPDEQKWRDNGNFGSGVGANISRRLAQKGFNMFHTVESLVEFVDCKTVMH